MAIGLKSGPTTGLSYATVRLLADGSVLVHAGTSDMGQGARTVFAQIASNELGVPLDRVTVVMGDTAVIPYDQQTSASRSTVFMGSAIQRACHAIHDRVRAMAAAELGMEADTVAVSDGVVHLPGGDEPIADVARRGLGALGGELIGNGEMRKDADPDHPLGGTAAFFEFNCSAAEVEVDIETGETTIHRFVAVGDAGLALNPTQAAGQDEGAAIMGLGHTLMEHMVLDDTGRILNLGALDYRIPTSKDVPLEMLSDNVENGDGPGPYGLKGISEAGLLATAPAVAAAVTAATGVVVRDLPLTPERVWRATREEQQ